jgi:DNA-directed RNA polymerase sigma subunit (sigma70/sigma32)
MECVKEQNKTCNCLEKSCRHWIDYSEDQNCSLIAVDKNGPLTLREVSERLGVSYVRIKQIQDKALEKLKLENFEFE